MYTELNWLQNNTEIHIEKHQNLSEQSTLKVGGFATILSHNRAEVIAESIAYLSTSDLFYYVIGDASNILFSNETLNFPLITSAALQDWHIEGNTLYAEAGVSISTLAKETAQRGLKGLENFYAMPGSIGGAVYMNARCFDGEIADVLRTVSYIDAEGERNTYQVQASDFSYKRSPFQNTPGVCIVACTIQLEKQDPQDLLSFAEQCSMYRQKKGHFEYPCAGSIFKNNRSFGAPTGALLDTLGMKELSVGGAAVSSKNANIIQNRNHAQFRDVMELIRLLEDRTVHELGFTLEREVEIVDVHR